MPESLVRNVSSWARPDPPRNICITNTEIQKQKYIYRNTNSEIQIQKYIYRNTNSEIQTHKYKYTITNREMQTQKNKYRNTNTNMISGSKTKVGGLDLKKGLRNVSE